MPKYSECTLLHGGLYHSQAQPEGDYLAEGGYVMTQDTTMPMRQVSG